MVGGRYLRSMSMLSDDSPIMTKARELCETIVAEANYQESLAKVETFLNNDEARLSYQNVHEKGQALNEKQRSGLQLADAEIHEFEVAREQLMQNDVAKDFMQAQEQLEMVQKAVSQYVGMTLELGRVPTAEDFAAAAQGGCCGGQDSGGCGCS